MNTCLRHTWRFAHSPPLRFGLPSANTSPVQHWVWISTSHSDAVLFLRLASTWAHPHLVPNGVAAVNGDVDPPGSDGVRSTQRAGPQHDNFSRRNQHTQRQACPRTVPPRSELRLPPQPGLQPRLQRRLGRRRIHAQECDQSALRSRNLQLHDRGGEVAGDGGVCQAPHPRAVPPRTVGQANSIYV